MGEICIIPLGEGSTERKCTAEKKKKKSRKEERSNSQPQDVEKSANDDGCAQKNEAGRKENNITQERCQRGESGKKEGFICVCVCALKSSARCEDKRLKSTAPLVLALD